MAAGVGGDRGRVAAGAGGGDRGGVAGGLGGDVGGLGGDALRSEINLDSDYDENDDENDEEEDVEDVEDVEGEDDDDDDDDDDDWLNEGLEGADFGDDVFAAQNSAPQGSTPNTEIGRAHV